MSLLEGVYEALEEIAEEERESFENLPEGIQDSEKGQLLDAYADAIEYAYEELNGVMGQLTDILEGQL